MNSQSALAKPIAPLIKQEHILGELGEERRYFAEQNPFAGAKPPQVKD